MASQIMDPHESGHDTGRNSIQFVRTALRHEWLRTVQEHGFAFLHCSVRWMDRKLEYPFFFLFVSFVKIIFRLLSILSSLIHKAGE